MKTAYAMIPGIRRDPIGTPRATRWCGSAPPSLSTWTNRGPLVPRLRPMLEDRDAAARPLPRLLALPRGELDRPLPGGGGHLGGGPPVRPAPRAPAPLHVLLGFALPLAQPRLARAGRGARPDPPRRGLRDGGEPPVAARHPRAVPALRALQVGVEDRELPRPVHRLEHGAQPLHQAPARQPRQRRAGAPRLRAGAGAGKLDHDVPRGDALARRAAARLQAGRLHARAADRRAHPAHRDRGHGERAAEARLRPAGTARDPGARARRDPPRELRARAGRGGDGGDPGAGRGRAPRARAGRIPTGPTSGGPRTCSARSPTRACGASSTSRRSPSIARTGRASRRTPRSSPPARAGPSPTPTRSRRPSRSSAPGVSPRSTASS